MRTPWPLVALALSACASSPARVAPTPVAHASPSSSPAPSTASASPSEPSSAPSEPIASPAVAAGPTAADRVRERLGALTPAPPNVAAWIPFEIIDVVDRVGGELGSSSAPEIHEDRVVWSLVIPAGPRAPDPAAFQAVCDAVTRTNAYLACAVDSVAVGATDRVRLAFGWRREAGRMAADLALPLRALARMHTGACLVSAERTARTLEIKLQVPDVPSLGRTLARLTAITPLNDLFLVGMQPAALAHGTAESATLSWPTDRVDRERADLGSDPWPTRCDEREVMSREAPAHSPLTPLLLVRGERARGAVVNIARREWVVTEGDTLGDARITSVNERGVYVARVDRPRARPTLARFVAQPAPGPGGPSRAPAALPPVRIPLPPEPPAPLP
ncbi:MAG: hypothetical protein WCJ30_12015 [Deltaproteobacteria bacterium]